MRRSAVVAGEESDTAKNGMRPVHPGEILKEDFLKPAGLSVNALAKALHVPAPRINYIVLERRGIAAYTACASRATSAAMPSRGSTCSDP